MGNSLTHLPGKMAADFKKNWSRPGVSGKLSVTVPISPAVLGAAYVSLRELVGPGRLPDVVIVAATLLVPLSVLCFWLVRSHRREEERLESELHNAGVKIADLERSIQAKRDTERESARGIHKMGHRAQQQTCETHSQSGLPVDVVRPRLTACCDDAIEYARMCCPHLRRIALHCELIGYAGDEKLTVVARDSRSMRDFADTLHGTADSQCLTASDLAMFRFIIERMDDTVAWATDSLKAYRLDRSLFVGPAGPDCAVAVRVVRFRTLVGQAGARDETAGFLVLFAPQPKPLGAGVFCDEHGNIDGRVMEVMAGMSDLVFPSMKRNVRPEPQGMVRLNNGRFWLDIRNCEFMEELHAAFLRDS